MSLPKDDCNTTVLNIDDELRVRITDKLLITGRLVAEIAEEFQVRSSLVVQVGRVGQSEDVVASRGAVDGELTVRVAEPACGADKASAVDVRPTRTGLEHESVGDACCGVRVEACVVKIPPVIGKNRTVTGDYAVANLNADFIILDDGYQHWQLARDLDVVLIDSINVFGNNFLLPRGTLREPLTHLDRADAFLLTKVDQATDDARDVIRETLGRYNERALVVGSVHSPRCFIEIAEWYKGVRPETIALETIRDKRVLAFSALGNPTSFEQTIADLGAAVVGAVRYPDHHDYTMAEMQAVMQKAVDCDVYALATTEKDAVKIPSEFIHSDRPLPVYVLGIEVRFIDGYQELMDLIKTVAEQGGKS